MSSAKCVSDQEKWSQAIADAETLLTKVQRKAIRLRSAIEFFKEYREAGESWTLDKQESATQN